MASISKKQRRLENEIAQLKIKKRNGLMRAAAAFVAMVVIIALKTSFTTAGYEWANTQIANMGIFILALVAAGVVGIGTRDWNRAKKAIEAREQQMSKKR